MAIDPLDPAVASLIRIKANKLVGHYGFTRSDVPDIEQELRMRLFKNRGGLAARSASQKTVLDTALRNAICNLIEGRTAKKRDDRRNIVVDDAPEDALGDNERHTDGLIDRIDIDDAIRSLPVYLQHLARMLKGCRPPDACRELGLTRGQLRHQIELIAKHFIACGIVPPNSQSGGDSGQ